MAGTGVVVKRVLTWPERRLWQLMIARVRKRLQELGDLQQDLDPRSRLWGDIDHTRARLDGELKSLQQELADLDHAWL